MKLLNILCIALLTAGVASAVVIDNAPDYRGDENSVHAVFDMASGPVGVPVPPVIFETGPSSYLLSPILPSVVSSPNSIYLTLPNFIDELPMKKMRIQLSFDAPVIGDGVIIRVIGYDPEPVTWNVVGGSDPSLPAFDHYIDIEMFPNPDWEDFTILNNSDPHNSPQIIEIDTISIPEPASMAMIGLVATGIWFKRRFFIA